MLAPARVAKIEIVVEEELRDGAARASVDLGLEGVNVRGERGSFRMLFGIGRGRDLEIGDLLDPFDKMTRLRITARMRLILGADAGDRIPA